MKKFFKELHDTWKELWIRDLSLGERVKVEVTKEWIDRMGEKRTYVTTKNATIRYIDKDADLYGCYVEENDRIYWVKRDKIKVK